MSRTIRVAAVCYGAFMVVNSLFSARIGDRAAIVVAAAALTSAVVILGGLIAAQLTRSRGAA